MKGTRLIYNDEEHLKMYEALPAEEFKEFFIAMLKYKYGDDTIIDTIQTPAIKALFMSEKMRIDYNEGKWEKKAKISRENGAKSKGRPKNTPQTAQVEESPSEDRFEVMLAVAKELNDKGDGNGRDKKLNEIHSFYPQYDVMDLVQMIKQ